MEKKEYNEAFQGVRFFKNTWEKVKVNFYSQQLPQHNQLVENLS